MHKRGFTLIELLVVITIMTLLVVVATTSYLTAQRSARDNTRKTSLNSMATALEAYRLSAGQYPGIVSPQTAVAAQVGAVGTENYCISSTGTYYYHPLGKCATPTAADGNNNISESETNEDLRKHRPSVYAPEPNWVPGLSKLLNPAILERRYLGVNGGTSQATFDAEGKPLFVGGDATNNNRTYSYKKTATGYKAYVTLENLDAFPNHIYSVSK